jgi:hypothetical protein
MTGPTRGDEVATRKRPTLEAELEALRGLDLDTPGGRDAVRRGLASARSPVVARAATLVKDARLDGFGAALETAFARFFADPVKHDPGCHAKRAALEALDFTEHPDPAPFLRAAGHAQLEPAWGPPVDTAAGLRARAVLGLARLGHPDLPLVAGELLADREAAVRQAAVEALVARGDPAAAGLLALKARLGDEEPMVLLACYEGLLALAPERALPRLAALLDAGESSEMAALALGQSGLDAALDLLLERVEATVLAAERAALWRALGLHRTERALAALLAPIAEGGQADAEAAIAALAVRRYDPGVPARARAAAARNRRARLDAALAETFAGDD